MKLKEVMGKYGIFIAFIVLCISLSIVSPYFFTFNNIINVLRQASVNGVLAIGMTFVILTRGIDLSVGSVLSCAGIVAASLASGADPYPIFVAFLAALVVGGVLGSVNGVLVSVFKAAPFVVTLGMLSVARGLTYIYNDGMPVSDLSPAYKFIGQGVLFGIPVPAVIFLTVFLFCWVLLSKTTFGRYVYAVGGNPAAARTSGLPIRGITWSVYAISGLLCGLGGLMLSARTSSALPQAGVAYELDAIAAVVIGGTSLAGGVGSLVGTLVGVLIIAVMNNGLDLLGVSSFYQQVVKGVIIVAAVLLDRSRNAHN